MEIIDYKFLESGHTDMECDNDHSIIEKARKCENPTIHHPADWFELVSKARTENLFDVIQMKKNKTSFFNFEDLYISIFVMRSKNQAKEKFLFQEVRLSFEDKL